MMEIEIEPERNAAGELVITANPERTARSAIGELLPVVQLKRALPEFQSDGSRTIVRCTVGNTEYRGWIWGSSSGDLLVVTRLVWMDAGDNEHTETTGDPLNGWPDVPSLPRYLHPRDRAGLKLIGDRPVAIFLD